MSNSAINLSGPIGPAQYRNKLINGDFSIWQRGNTFGMLLDGTTSGGLLDCYTSDRWLVRDGGDAFKSDAGGTCCASVVREKFGMTQTDVPGYPEYHLRYTMKRTNGYWPSILQRIEDCRTLAGKDVTVSFWAKASGITCPDGTLPITTSIPVAVECMQYLGGAEERQINGNLAMIQGATGCAGNVNAYGHHRLTYRKNIRIYSAGWKKYEVTMKLQNLSGLTLGIDKNNWGVDDNPFSVNYLNKPNHFLQIALRLPGSTFGVNELDEVSKLVGANVGDDDETLGYTLDVALMQFEEGDASSDFEFRGKEQELFMCSRYFQRCYYGHNTGGQDVQTSVGDMVSFVPKMRVTPVPVRKTHIFGWRSEQIDYYTGELYDSAAMASAGGNDDLEVLVSPDYGLARPAARGSEYEAERDEDNVGGTQDAGWGSTIITKHGWQPSIIKRRGDSAYMGVMDFDAEIVTWGEADERFAKKYTLTNPAPVGFWMNQYSVLTTRYIGGGNDDYMGYSSIPLT